MATFLSSRRLLLLLVFQLLQTPVFYIGKIVVGVYTFLYICLEIMQVLTLSSQLEFAFTTPAAHEATMQIR